VGSIRQLANKISLLDSRDPFRSQQEKALLDKLYNMGIITATTKFSDCRKVTVSAFCRRRLPIVMCRLKMAETVKEAVTFVEQGHIRVGPQTVTDPAFLVNRTMEDYVTWVDTSKIKRKIMKYNDKVRKIISINSRLLKLTLFFFVVGRLRSFVKCIHYFLSNKTYFCIIVMYNLSGLYRSDAKRISQKCLSIA
jgi:ribosomal protein S4